MTTVADLDTLAPFSDTAALQSVSMAMIIESHHRIAMTQERLSRQPRRRSLICGGGESPVPERVRAALADGTLLPLDGNRSWAGRGTGRTCHVCALRIESGHIEHEVDLSTPIVVHAECLMIWREESRRHTPRRRVE